ncbi:hypothetical protein [Labrenzia sp. CE80]|uniref:hypothetical protein n=1 Tax=Labrenzia sp. CE80 TaxID=1788986 RepID=UPI00129AC7C8|nr:hypothetical protein [Labrenzia sp. CE80]
MQKNGFGKNTTVRATALTNRDQAGIAAAAFAVLSVAGAMAGFVIGVDIALPTLCIAFTAMLAATACLAERLIEGFETPNATPIAQKASSSNLIADKS